MPGSAGHHQELSNKIRTTYTGDPDLNSFNELERMDTSQLLHTMAFCFDGSRLAFPKHVNNAYWHGHGNLER